MHLTFRNVNEAFAHLVTQIHTGRIAIRSSPSRYGDVLVIDEPVTITYTNPTERVLFNTARDANPFFHLYESLWMLAGRNEVAPLAYFNSRMPEFSDDGTTFNAAYGYRWRNHTDWRPEGKRRFKSEETGEEKDFYPGVDQLKLIISHLRQQPWSRRVVLAMWSVEDDLLKIGLPCPACGGQVTGGPEWEWVTCHGCNNTGGTPASKDIACNTHAYFLVRPGKCPDCEGVGLRHHTTDYPIESAELCKTCKGEPYPVYLDITVCNRSNDMVWGMLGANYVQFTMLQEYIAAHLDLAPGKYHQVTNNLHVYTATWNAEAWLAYYQSGVWDWYSSPKREVDFKDELPLVENSAIFDRELPEFVRRHSRDAVGNEYKSPFLEHVAQPAFIAWHYHKRREYDNAFQTLAGVQALDWRTAMDAWLRKRAEKYRSK